MPASSISFRVPPATNLFYEDGNQNFANTGVEGDPAQGEADSFLVAESDTNPRQPQRSEVSSHAQDGTGVAETFVRLQSENGATRVFDLLIQPNTDDATPTLQLLLPTNDVDVAVTAGAIVAYLRITAGAGAGLPTTVYKIPLYAVS